MKIHNPKLKYLAVRGYRDLSVVGHLKEVNLEGVRHPRICGETRLVLAISGDTPQRGAQQSHADSSREDGSTWLRWAARVTCSMQRIAEISVSRANSLALKL